jgi:hypothetical protein
LLISLEYKSYTDSENADESFKFTSIIVHEAKKKKCFCRMHNQKRILWEVFIVIVAIINWFIAPYGIAFIESYYEDPVFTIMNWLIDVIFLIDIVVVLRTSFILKDTGEEITNTNAIIMHYIKDRFLIDFLAAFPSELIALAFF